MLYKLLPQVKIRFLLFLFQFSTLLIYSQKSNVDEARARFPDASAIYLYKSQEFKIIVENGTLKGICKVHEQILINKEAGINYQTRYVSSNSFVEATDIIAFTLVPDKKKFVKKMVEKISQKDDPDRSSFYDDVKSYSIVFPSVQVGAILDLEYTFKYKEPRFMGSYYWTDYIPVVQNELKISTQSDIHINYHFFNKEVIDVEFTKEVKKNETIYKWETINVKPIIQYSDAPNIRYYEPHMIFYITDFEVNKQRNQLLGSPKNLYSWYSELQKNVNKTEDKRLKKITDSLIYGIADDFEKVKKIFYWVQDNISYIAIEDGLGGFIARDAGLVCSKKFGDCKDMASIIHEMLRIAGIKSYLTWIGSRDIPYSYTDAPTPGTDNHMITSYLDKKGEWKFLDGTGKNAPIELHTSFIQGKQALIGISPDSFLIVTVPVKDTSVSQTIDSVTIDIKGNLVTGKGKATLKGYDMLDYLYHSQNLSKEELQDYIRGYFSKGSNKVVFFDVVMEPSERGPLKVFYNFSLPNYVRCNQNEMYINLNMNSTLSLEKIVETRAAPINFKHKTIKKLITVLNIPEDYKIEYIPKSVSLGNEIVGFQSTYNVKNNKIILVSDFYINTLLLNAKDFETYNKILIEQVKANSQVISLIKK